MCNLYSALCVRRWFVPVCRAMTSRHLSNNPVNLEMPQPRSATFPRHQKQESWEDKNNFNTPRLYSQLLNSVISTSFGRFADVSLRFHNLRRCNVVFYRVNNVRNACKQQRYSKNCWRDCFMRWRKVGRIWSIQLRFRRFLCVRIEIDQLLCVICWVINQSLSVNCK